MSYPKCPNCQSRNVGGCLWHDVMSCGDCGLEWRVVEDLALAHAAAKAEAEKWREILRGLDQERGR